jgi:hypothetical protein
MRGVPVLPATMSSDVSKAEEGSERWPCDGDKLFVSASWACDAEVIRDPETVDR